MNNPYVDLLNKNGDLKVKPDEVIILVPEHNSGGKVDATGAFHPGAIDFCDEHLLPHSVIRYFDNRKPRREIAEEVLPWLEESYKKVLVAFCHGYTHGVQYGIRSPGHPYFNEADRVLWDRYVDARVMGVGEGFTAPIDVLFACSTGDDPDGDPDSAPGSGDGSFADLLRDAMCNAWAVYGRVYAHTTAGHSWFNPMVKLFDGVGFRSGGVGAELVADIGSSEMRKLKNILKTPKAFRLPFMRIDDINQLLS